jgi:hypothetical protein
MDWALDGPIPWADEACARAGTVHFGDTLEDIAASERQTWNGGHQTDLSCSDRSRRASTPRAPRSASTPSGPTATFRTIPTPTCGSTGY